MTDKVSKLTLVIQEVPQKDADPVVGLFGTLLLKPEDPKKKTGEQINFISRLNEVPAFEKHINRIISEALKLKK